MNTCTRHIKFAKRSTVALALWVSIAAADGMNSLRNMAVYYIIHRDF